MVSDRGRAGLAAGSLVLAVGLVLATKRKKRSHKLGKPDVAQALSATLIMTMQAYAQACLPILSPSSSGPHPFAGTVAGTSATVAAVRAIESQNPEPLFVDPLAEALAGPEPMHAIREHIRKVAVSPEEVVSVRPPVTLHCLCPAALHTDG